VVPLATAEEWLNQLMEWDWRKNPGIGFAAMLIARASGDRERDVGGDLREKVAARLRSGRAPDAWTELVCRPQALSAAEERRVFGEALPTGLTLID
jgi:hypothetical protein